MTLQYLQLHRYNAQPRAEHIDAPQSQAPQFNSLDEMIAAMKADAKQVNKAQSWKEPKATNNGEEIPDEFFLNLIKENPGLTAMEIAKAIDRTPATARARMGGLAKLGFVKMGFTKDKANNNKKLQVYYYNHAGPKYDRRADKPSPKRDALIAFVRENPGADTHEIAKHVGIERKGVSAAVKRARKLVDIRCERQPGNPNQPARYWIVE